MANGKFGGGTGALTTPFLVTDAADLDAVRNNLGACYRLATDVDLTSISNWTPISGFKGFIDGGYHVVRNLTINAPSTDNVGLIGTIVGTFAGTTSSVANLGLVDCNVTGGKQVGGLVGAVNCNGVGLVNCSVEGKVNGQTNVGGLVGYCLERTKCSFTNIVTDVVVGVIDDYAGGCVGKFTSPFADSTASTLTNVLVYGSITGGNFITARAVTGDCQNSLLTNCVYVADAVGRYVDAQASGVSAASLMTLDAQLDLRYVATATGDQLYRFSLVDVPRLAFTRRQRFTIAYGGAQYVYTGGNWTPVVITTFNDADALGMTTATLRAVPIDAMRALVTHGQVTLTCYTNAPRAATATSSVFVLMDRQASTQSMPLTTFTLTPAALTTDYEMSTCSVVVNADTALPVGTPTCIVAYEDELGSTPSTAIAVAVDTKLVATDVARKLRITGKADAITSARPAYRGFIDNHRSLTTYASTERTYTGVRLSTATEAEVHGGSAKLAALAVVDANRERTSLDGNLIYEVYNTITTQPRAARVDAKGDATSRFMLSVTNGRTWLTFDQTAGAWVDAKLVDIHSTGVSADTLTTRKIMNALPSDYRSALKLAAGVSIHAFNTSHSVDGFTVEFEPNQGPQVVPSAVVDDAKNRVVVTGTLYDRENDDISYRVLVKATAATAWTQILPDVDGTWFKRANGYAFSHAFALSNFRAGSNVIKVQTKDSRGAVYENTATVTLASGEPSITINSQNSFYLNATLDHSSSRNVRFKILVNGEQLAPRTGWSEWKPTPYTFDFTWDSDDVLHGLPNDVQLVVEDELCTEAVSKFNVIGEYKSLLFKDINGFYYSTDKGEVLQQLDFGTVTGGTLTAPQLVYLENKTGLPMENVSIYVDLNTDEPHTKVKLSKTSTPFDDVDELVVPGVLADNASHAFYVRIDADLDTVSFRDKVFRVRAKGDPVV